MKLMHLLAAAIALQLSATALAEPGVSDKEILLGQSAALSGPAKELGSEMRSGALLYFEQVNAGGGIHGRRIKLQTLDDGYEPERTTANTRKLIEEEKVLALFGYVGTPTSLAALPLFTEAKVPFVGAFTGAQALREPFNRYVFNVRASYFDETEKIVEQLTTTGVKQIAVFYQNDAYGKAGLAGVERAMTKRGLKVTATATVERNTADVAKAVASLAATRPDAVVMVSAYTSVAAFVKGMKKAGSATQFHNVSFVGSKPLALALGDDGVGVAIAQVVPFPWSGTQPVTREYQAQARAAGAKDLSFTELEGYIAARVLVEGLKRAGRELTRERLVTALESLSRTDIGGFQIDYSPSNHNGSTFVDLTIIGRGGKFLR
ncbi:MAG: ABC transporter substrate-binding protein [Rhodocyclaceae bacterium]|nr:ABC transporter substrate-binding protein [Rhodocyclaceae bacterium]